MAFKYLIHALHCIQIALIFLAFFTTLYWLLQVANVGWTVTFAPIFEPIKGFVHLFYTRTVTAGEATVDFSFLVGSFLMLTIVWGIRLSIEAAETAEKKYDAIHRELKAKEEEVFNSNLEMEYKYLEHKNNKFVVILKLEAIDLKKDAFFQKDMGPNSSDQSKKAIEIFSELLNKCIKFNKKILDDKILLYFDKIEAVDLVLKEIIRNVNLTKAKFREEGWNIKYLGAIEVYSEEKELVEKCKNILLLIKLNLKEEIVALGSFKQRYSMLENNKWAFVGKGIYKIMDEEEVFSLKLKQT